MEVERAGFVDLLSGLIGTLKLKKERFSQKNLSRTTVTQRQLSLLLCKMLRTYAPLRICGRHAVEVT